MVLVSAVLLLAGLALLVAGGEALVRGGSRLAAAFGVSPLVIGLTIVAFGTSAPEFVVSVLAASQGSPGIALGNVLGSNIANILLVLGATAVVAPIPVQARVVRREVPILIGVSLLATTLALGGRLSRPEGFLLVLGLLAYLTYILRSVRQEPPAIQHEFEEGLHLERNQVWHRIRDGFLVLGGLALLIGGARLAVTGATEIAEAFGLSERVIGLTVIAVGTTLPEIATTLVAAYRRQIDLAVGNMVGSNLFNTLGILGASVLVNPIPVPPEVLRLDFFVMLAAAAATLPVVWTHHRISRVEGALLVVGYVTYLSVLLTQG